MCHQNLGTSYFLCCRPAVIEVFEKKSSLAPVHRMLKPQIDVWLPPKQKRGAILVSAWNLCEVKLVPKLWNIPRPTNKNHQISSLWLVITWIQKSTKEVFNMMFWSIQLADNKVQVWNLFLPFPAWALLQKKPSDKQDKSIRVRIFIARMFCIFLPTLLCKFYVLGLHIWVLLHKFGGWANTLGYAYGVT